MAERLLPKIHPREKIVKKAERDLQLALSQVLDENELTVAEELRVLTSVLHGALSSIVRAAIRQERHPGDPDKPGGTA